MSQALLGLSRALVSTLSTAVSSVALRQCTNERSIRVRRLRRKTTGKKRAVSCASTRATSSIWDIIPRRRHRSFSLTLASAYAGIKATDVSRLRYRTDARPYSDLIFSGLFTNFPFLHIYFPHLSWKPDQSEKTDDEYLRLKNSTRIFFLTVFLIFITPSFL